MGAYPQIADWNADGKKDLLVGDSQGKITYFRNTGTNASPVLTNAGFIKAGGVDILVNTRSTPVVVDWNNDGKQDLVVGEHTSGAPAYGPGFVRLYLNTGTNAAPAFSASYQKIQAGGNDIQFQATAPEVCDLDGDGKKDLIVGELNAYIYFFKNTGTDANPSFTSGERLMAGTSYLKINGYYSRPDAVDWNGDGSIDLLVGDRESYINLFKNAATTTPVLSVSPASLDFGTTISSLPLNIKNTGVGNLIWSITENPEKEWLTVSPGNGTNNQTVTVTVDRSKVTGTSDTGTLVVNSNGGGPINITVKVSNPASNPVLFVDPTTLDFGTTQTSLSLNIKNAGGGTLNWTISEKTDLADLIVERAWLVIPDGDDNADNDVEITSPTTGQQIRLICKVTNNGTVAANNWKIQGYMDEVLIAEGTFSLAAGNTTHIWRSDPWTATVGPHQLEWKVDTDNVIPESDETNNSASNSFTVTGSGLADLVAERAYLVKPDTDNDIGNDVEVATPAAGQQVRLICKINNMGAADANNWKIQGYLDGALLAQGTFSLKAGYTSWIWRSTPWTATVGTHTLEWKVDTDNVITESDETNNSASYSFNVTGLAENYLLSNAANDLTLSDCQKSLDSHPVEAIYQLEMAPIQEMNRTPQVEAVGYVLADWLTYTPASGSNTAGITKTVTVTVDRSKLSGNTGTATLWVNSNGGNKNVIIKVEKSVTNPLLWIDPTLLDFGETLTTLILSIKNNGDGTLNWNIAESPLKDWLNFTPNSGSCGIGITKTVTVTVDRSQLAPQNDIGTLKITSNGGNKDITVKIAKFAPGGIPIHPIAASAQGPGTEFWVDIKVGDNANPVSDLFGISFDLTFTQTDYVDVVSPYSTNVIPGSFMGSDLVFFQVVDDAAGKVSIGISRKSGQGGVNGQGLVAQVKFITKSGTPPNTAVQFAVTNVTANKSNGETITLVPGSVIVTIISDLSVWPGDTNNDGVVNQADEPFIGLNWKKTGPKRTCHPMETTWMGHTAMAWVPLAATYIDANGDGIIKQADILPIGLNWGKTHSMNSVNALDLPPADISQNLASNLKIVTMGSQRPGKDFSIDIYANEVSDLFGLSYELIYTPISFIELLSVEPDPGNFLGKDLVFFQNVAKSAGNDTGFVSLGISRKAGQPGVNGAGLVTRIKTHMSSSAILNQSKTFLVIKNIVANDPLGNPIRFDTLKFELITAIETMPDYQPTAFVLYDNFPNPFNPETTIGFELPQQAELTLIIYDLHGQEVRRFALGEKVPGYHSVNWNARNEAGEAVASGIYFYRIEAKARDSEQNRFQDVKKMILIK